MDALVQINVDYVVICMIVWPSHEIGTLTVTHTYRNGHLFKLK